MNSVKQSTQQLRGQLAQVLQVMYLILVSKRKTRKRSRNIQANARDCELNLPARLLRSFQENVKTSKYRDITLKDEVSKFLCIASPKSLQDDSRKNLRAATSGLKDY